MRLRTSQVQRMSQDHRESEKDRTINPGRSVSCRFVVCRRHQLKTYALVLKTGLISQASGSGYIEAGGVKIACSV
jgi:hypothetical protein